LIRITVARSGISIHEKSVGQVRLGLLTSPACDGEDALIDDIRLVKDPAGSE
jgi:hypothetical protein